MLKYLLIVIYSLFQVTAYASGPFTQEIGIEKKPEIIEVEIEKEDVVEIILEDETENLIDIIEEKKDEVVVDKEIKETENNQMVTILNIDPVVAYPLKNYKLKGIALSYDSKHKFKRKKIKKFDQAKIPTTHTIQENDTVEKIAFRYGFSLREIEIANAIYPGSRKLVTGDKLVIPNRFHIIKEGQTLSSIADRYKIDPVQLATYNNIRDEDILFIGNKLLLPFFIHVTVENEDIKYIAGKYEREVSELIEFNSFEEKTLTLNKHQLVKIPIYANKNIEYSTLDQKSINDFEIDKKNLAIVEIQSGQYMVREGDKIGNGDGVIVSIESNKMIVLQNNIEFQFFINAPIVGQSIASLPQQIEDSFINEENNMLEEESSSQKSNNNQSNNNEEDLITNIEDLFN